MKLKQLEHFNAGYESKGSVEDVLAFVLKTPTLQRLSIWNRLDMKNELSLLFKAIRDETRSSGSSRQLWVSQDDVLYLALDLRDNCTDSVIEKIVNEMTSKYRFKLPHC